MFSPDLQMKPRSCDTSSWPLKRELLRDVFNDPQLDPIEKKFGREAAREHRVSVVPPPRAP